MDNDPVNIKKRRSTVKASCTRIRSYVDSISSLSPSIILQLEERKVKLDQYWADYNVYQTQLEMLDESEANDRVAFEEAFFNLSSKMRELMQTQSTSRNAVTASPTLSNASDMRETYNVRLPKLDLPKFSGKFDEWFPFRDSFLSIIHANTTLSDIQKLQYLRATLTDEASNVLSPLEISEANYAVAWDLLKERFDNKRDIVQTHLKSIIELPVMTKENVVELRQIADGSARHMLALKALKRPTEHWDDLLVYLLSSKLDPTTEREWRLSLKDSELPTLKQFHAFLAHRCQAIESTGRSSNTSTKNVNSRSQANNKQRTSCNASVSTKCDFCKGEHAIYQCKQFLALPILKRIAEIRSRKICLNCLRSTAHNASKCTSGTCRICSRKHNTLLHIPESSDRNKASDDHKEEASSSESTNTSTPHAVVSHASNTVDSKCILLSTAVALVQSKNGSLQPCRVLLDSGSQANFISKDTLNTLGLIPRSIDISISGINGTTTRSNQAVQLKLQSRLNSYSTIIDCIVTDRVTDDIPSSNVKRTAFEIPRNIELADPNFHIASKIDILIGADTFWNLICVGQIKPSQKHPTLQKTRLGWILAGRLNNSVMNSRNMQSFHASLSNSELNEQLSKFWQLDEIHYKSNSYTLEESFCVKHFLENVSTNEQGRYIVKLPLKEELIVSIGNSRNIALSRLQGLERRFVRDPHLKKRYSDFIDEYLTLGHMKPIVEQSSNESGAYYLPHHCVLKESAKSTKLRVVFDGSCKTDTGISLNDSMMIGPVVQEDLMSILMRFRIYIYVIVADIIKMYRQILLHPSQTKLQRILWRLMSDLDVKIYELLTVTYGTAAASFLATMCLKHLAEKYAHVFPIGSLHVIRNFYGDDLLTGANTISEAMVIRDQVVQLLKLASFELSKWGSNCPELLNGVSDQSEGLVPFDKDSDFRILGILWDRDDDTFRFSYKPSQQPNVVTKRSILSEVSRLFDPLGLLGPIIVIAKLIIQDLWISKVDWDESIQQDSHTKWLRLKLQLPCLNQFHIPRCVGNFANPKSTQIHGFCDASQRAYGACVYIRMKVGHQRYQSNLLCSKSRVAPLKAVTLPRLELQAALLLSQLVDKIRSSIDLTDVEVFLSSDSKITLNWIASPSRKWSTFVANRVGEIQRLTDISSWRHVASCNNPADILSRGSFPDDLIDSHMWWHGPSFLLEPDGLWPSGEYNSFDGEIPEQRIVCTAVVSIDCEVIDDLLNKFSSVNKICRILAYCSRFTKPQDSISQSIEISPKEIINSLNIICKVVQMKAFINEYHALKNQNDISKSSCILSLSPFMSEDGLIRVGGRLKNSALSFDACHQIVLPRNHILTKRIIEFEHQRNMHSPLQATMAAVRQRFWPLSLRSSTRKIINNCVICFKAKPIFSETIMGSLPAPRVNVSRPFSHCGVDYAGPVTLREGKRRNSRNHKAYIAVFVCFATKALHLELVSDLTTDAFISSLKRLISRRGKPERMYSDNATTFVGAQRQIKEFYDFLKTEQAQNSIEHFLRDQQTEWHFIPPNAPHFGGLWEAAVKSAKFHLTRIVGTANLTFEEMSTVLCEIEAILNSRPLVPLTSDSNDLGYLSPGHFLVGSPLNSFPARNLTDVNTNKLLRWQVVEQMRQHFWHRWSSEYLNSLQERHKWKMSKGQQLKLDQLVLIKQQGVAPLQWITGRIEDIHLGSDGLARSAKVRTSKGSYVRPLSKLAILPI